MEMLQVCQLLQEHLLMQDYLLQQAALHQALLPLWALVQLLLALVKDLLQVLSFEQ